MTNFGSAIVKMEGALVESFGAVDETPKDLNAAHDLTKFLEEGEVVEAVVFGEYGWSGYKEDVINPIPENKRGVVLTWDQAQPLMQGWSFYGGYGAPECYATYVWTNRRVIWVTQYDGSTSLDSAPRSPMPCIPDMPGG